MVLNEQKKQQQQQIVIKLTIGLISFHLEMAKKASTTTTNENFQFFKLEYSAEFYFCFVVVLVFYFLSTIRFFFSTHKEFHNYQMKKNRFRRFPSNHRHHFDFYSSSS